MATAKRGKKPLDSKRKTNGRNEKGQFDKGNKIGNRFVKGYDPNRNYHGRPSDLADLRELVRDVGEEEIKDDSGHLVGSRIYGKVRQMYASKDGRTTETLLGYGWGKLKDETEQSGEIIIRIIRDDGSSNPPADAASGTGADQTAGKKV